MELCLLLIAGVLRVRIHSFLFQSLPNYLAFDEFFSSLEVIHGGHDLGVGGHLILLRIGEFRPHAVLGPG